MRHRLLLAVAILCGLAFVAAPLVAHHSVAAQFDRTKPVTLTGPVTKLDWINPHARFLMEVKDAEGKVTRWEVELSAPAMLIDGVDTKCTPYRWNRDRVVPARKMAPR